MGREIVAKEPLESKILLIRGYRVIIDSTLADVYGTTTKRLNEQVQRNKERFPSDFMFQLSISEYNPLRSQFAASKGRGVKKTAGAFC